MPLAAAAGAAALELLAAVRVTAVREQRAALGGKLYARELGAGQPIVFLSGLAGTTAYWGHGFDALARDRRLLFVDALGFGRSPWPDLEYTLDQHLEALRATLVARGAVSHVTLVGHSFGAMLGAHYAARFPAEVDRVYLLGAPIFRDETEARARIRAMSRTAGLFSLNRLMARETCKLHEAFGPPIFRLLSSVAGGLPPGVLAEGSLHTWQAFDGTLRNVVMGAPIEGPLRSIGSRATLVHGSRDPITTLARVRAVAAAVGANVIETADDHTSYAWREPERIVRALGTVGDAPPPAAHAVAADARPSSSALE